MTVQVTETQSVVIEAPGDSSHIIVAETSSAQVIELPVSGPQGPIGNHGTDGANGADGAPGAPGGQPVPVTSGASGSTWTVAHSFPYLPSVITRDISGAVIEGDVSYPDSAHVTVDWSTFQSGTIEMM
jgi:hypothetical protein